MWYEACNREILGSLERSEIGKTLRFLADLKKKKKIAAKENIPRIDEANSYIH